MPCVPLPAGAPEIVDIHLYFNITQRMLLCARYTPQEALKSVLVRRLVCYALKSVVYVIRSA